VFIINWFFFLKFSFVSFELILGLVQSQPISLQLDSVSRILGGAHVETKPTLTDICCKKKPFATLKMLQPWLDCVHIKIDDVLNSLVDRIPEIVQSIDQKNFLYQQLVAKIRSMRPNAFFPKTPCRFSLVYVFNSFVFVVLGFVILTEIFPWVFFKLG